MHLTINKVLGRYEVYNALYILNQNSSENIDLLDLSKVEVIEPFGMTMLLQLMEIFSVESIILPNANVTTYMIEANFFEFLSHDIKQETSLFPNSNKQFGTPLLGVHYIREKSDSDKALLSLLKQSSSVLKTELGFSDNDVADIISILSELLGNIPRHSQCHGYICGEICANERNKYLSVCISDTGIGIRKSLEPKRKTSQWDDSIALHTAVIEGVTRKQRGGLGFKGIRQKIATFKGNLFVKSGLSEIAVTGNDFFVLNSPYFPGTQLELQLPMKSSI